MPHGKGWDWLLPALVKGWDLFVFSPLLALGALAILLRILERAWVYNKEAVLV